MRFCLARRDIMFKPSIVAEKTWLTTRCCPASLSLRKTCHGAALLYRETEASMAARAEELARRAASAATEPKLSARPTKRDRRRLLEFLDKA